MMFEKYILNKKKEELKKLKEIFNNNINKIIEILINVKENIEYYYKIEENIINNYNIKERNYYLILTKLLTIILLKILLISITIIIIKINLIIYLIYMNK